MGPEARAIGSPVRPDARSARSRLRGRVAALLALATVSGTPRETSAEPEAAWTYEVSVAEDLSRVSVRLCFSGFRPRRLGLVSGFERAPQALPSIWRGKARPAD